VHQTASRRTGLLSGLSERAYGVTFLLVLALLVALAIASYAKVFVPVVRVTLEANRIGNQMQEMADVKVRGLIVGEVREVTSDGRTARLELALDPDQVELIPANVTARLLPKTLFGEKYVSLVIPDEPADGHIRAGDVIDQDRSETALELEQVLDEMLPLLQAVQPQDLALTLNALATALDGRGERLGENLTLVNEYFTALNPSMPTLQQDISGLADLASLYADAAPDLLRMLRNQAVTATTLVEKQDVLASFLAGTAGFARTTDTVLRENEQRIIRVGQVSRPTLDVLARYSPIYPCLSQGMAQWIPRIEGAFSGPRGLHITLEVVPQREPYVPGEEPEYNERRGPDCVGLPSPGGSQAAPFPGDVADDGSRGPNRYVFSGLPTAFVGPTSGVAGTPAEQRVVGALLAPQMGLEPEEVPAISTLLFGPLARGTEVGQR
jgi:phospholipid/cholesterol/gamma-HCH transport system substrate-binding protein